MIGRDNSNLADREAGWLFRAVTAGFFATVLATCVFAFAYWLASLFGSSNPQAPLFLRWTWALVHNTVTSEARNGLAVAVLLHFLAGIGWAVVYATVAEPHLSGPGWRRGVVFALAPWLLSLVVFLPAVGGGPFGLALGAGPLPILGNLILHLAYGAALGALYMATSDRTLSERGEESPGELLALTRSGQTMAIGIVGGLLIGAVVGALFGDALTGLGPLLTLVYGAIMGSALGALVGAFWGLSPRAD